MAASTSTPARPSDRNVGETSRNSGPESWFTVFLSHSGRDKEFVRSLCKALKRAGYGTKCTIFFDEKSLEKGEDFPARVKAACKSPFLIVAVVVLSVDYVTSKWPMLELTWFMEAKQNVNEDLCILPVFYGLYPEDITGKSSEKWEDKWELIAASEVSARRDDPFTTDKAHNALRVLRKLNGVVVSKSDSEEMARESIVESISGLVPRDWIGDTSSIVGYFRLCETVEKMFAEAQEGPQIVCLYGMSGMGKTTLCKGLCTFFCKILKNRVCYVDLGDEESPLQRLQMVMSRLLRYKFKDPSSIDEGPNFLKNLAKRKPVFLALDNVTSKTSLEEAERFLQAGFSSESKILITTTDLDAIEGLAIKGLLDLKKNCYPMPNLNDAEAHDVFLQVADPDRLSLFTEENLKSCVDECCFPTHDSIVQETEDKQYHPLALTELAKYRRKCVISSFPEANIRKFKQFRTLHETLGLPFKTLDVEVFLYLALYCNERRRSFNYRTTRLADLLDRDMNTLESKVSELKKAGVINWPNSERGCGVDDKSITIHALYHDYAQWYVIEVGHESCVYLDAIHSSDPTMLPARLNESKGQDKIKLLRIKGFKFANFAPGKVQEWCNIKVLQIQSCEILTKLELHGLPCLRHLELVDLQNLKQFSITSTPLYPALSNDLRKDMRDSLQYVYLQDLKKLNTLPDFIMCSKLKVFVMENCPNVTKPPCFKHCGSLETIKMDWSARQKALPNLHTLTSLKSLSISDINLFKEFKGKSDLKLCFKCCTQLEELSLSYLPILELEGLERLENLRCPKLTGCYLLNERHGVNQRRNLNIRIIEEGEERAFVDKIRNIQASYSFKNAVNIFFFALFGWPYFNV